ncbi:MAG: nucleotidyltransferase domain-containing protein [Nanoarchaeota archaeon]
MENPILTAREMEVINKKLNNKRLTQLDSNILTRAIRPKLRQIMNIEADYLLKRLSYNPRYRVIENKIKNIILSNITKVEAIILMGSAVQTSYNEYNDIDIIVIAKKRVWNEKYEREEIILDLEEKAKKSKLNLDIQIISKKSFLESYHNNPSLIYQLKDHKIIYGKIKIPKKVELSKLDLLMKLDWSDPPNIKNGKEIYECIRNLWLVKLLIKKIVDNNKLSSELTNELGRNLISRLKNNRASLIEKKLALGYLIRLLKETEQEIKEAKWEKIVL